MSNSLVQACIAHFDSVFEGPNGDYPAVLETLAGLTAAQAAWAPALHCNAIMDWACVTAAWLNRYPAAPHPAWRDPADDH